LDETEDSKKPKSRREREAENPDRDPEVTTKEAKFDEWLQVQKQKWRAARAEKGKQKKASINSVARTGGAQKLASLSKKDLEVIQIAETDVPGEFLVWALIGGRNLSALKLKIPRKFFINTRIADEQGNGKKVLCNLPRSKHRQFLYEYNIDEIQFRKNSKV
jgi:DNA polymerase epsilon subunit 1